MAAEDESLGYLIYQLDVRGNVRRVVQTSTGAVVAEYDYDAFGNLTLETGSYDQPLRFQGRLWFPDVGLYNVRARWYDPSLGRFLSEDPEWPAEPSPYTFGAGNPFMFSDPTGRSVSDLLRGALGAAGIASDPFGGLQRWADLNRCMSAADAYRQWGSEMVRAGQWAVATAVITGGLMRGFGARGRPSAGRPGRGRPHKEPPSGPACRNSVAA